MSKYTVQDALSGPVNVRYLIDSLDFSDEDVVEASKAQGKLFLEASRLRIRVMRERVQAEANVSVIKSARSLKIRDSSKDSGERVTEGYVAARLMRYKPLREATTILNKATEDEEFSKLLLEAYRMRRDALKVVAEVIGAEIYVNRLNVSGESGKDLKAIKANLMRKYKK